MTTYGGDLTWANILKNKQAQGDQVGYWTTGPDGNMQFVPDNGSSSPMYRGTSGSANPLAVLNSMVSGSGGGGSASQGKGLPAQTGTPAQPTQNVDPLTSLISSMMGPVPSALSNFGTQSSIFGTQTGLGNPALLPLLLLLANRPVTSVPFDPVVQQGSPDAVNGYYNLLTGLPYFPTVGQPLPAGTAPHLGVVPPVPGGASNLPGPLAPVGHGPFSPGMGFGEPGGGEGGGGGGGFQAPVYTVSNTQGGYTPVPQAKNTQQAVAAVPRQPGMPSYEVYNPQGQLEYMRGEGGGGQ